MSGMSLGCAGTWLADCRSFSSDTTNRYALAASTRRCSDMRSDPGPKVFDPVLADVPDLLLVAQGLGRGRHTGRRLTVIAATSVVAHTWERRSELAPLRRPQLASPPSDWTPTVRASSSSSGRRQKE